MGGGGGLGLGVGVEYWGQGGGGECYLQIFGISMIFLLIKSSYVLRVVKLLTK